MLSYPVQHAAPSLRGKPPNEMPHGLLVPPPEVKQALEDDRGKHRPEVFADYLPGALSRWTVDWYFDGLGHEVIYRETPEGPEVLAVGYEEVAAFKERVPFDERRDFKTYQGY